MDLLGAAEARALQGYMAEQPGVATVLPTSAVTGRGVEAVREWAVAQLPEGPTLYPKVPGAGQLTHCGQGGLRHALQLPWVFPTSPQLMKGLSHVMLGTFESSADLPCHREVRHAQRGLHISAGSARCSAGNAFSLVQDDVSEHPERFFVGEIIREKIFEQYREEVPYATMVRRRSWRAPVPD